MTRHPIHGTDLLTWILLIGLYSIITTVSTYSLDRLDLSDTTVLEFLVEPSDVVVLRRNDSLSLNCSGWAVNGSVVISWFKDDVLIVPDENDRRTVLPDGTLYFKYIVHNRSRRPTDEGIYRCSVRAPGAGAIISRPARLQMPKLGTFTSHPESLTVSTGESAYFRCDISGLPEPQITWEKDDHQLPLDQRYLHSSVNSLVIRNVSTMDMGLYHCRAKNVARDRVSFNAQLTVLSPVDRISVGELSWLKKPTLQRAVVGSRVTFECLINSFNSATSNVTWSRKEDFFLSPSRFRILDGGSLIIEDVKEDDAGEYVCTSMFKTSMSATATLSVLVPPRVEEVSEDVEEYIADPVKMSCVFRGSPSPVITWMKDGELLRPHGPLTIDGGSLSLRVSQLDDTGLYQCCAENEVGWTSAVISLTVLVSDEIPGPPMDVRVKAVTSKSIRITWRDSPPLNEKSWTIGYSIHCMAVRTGVERDSVSDKISEEFQDFEIPKLLPFTNYSIRVRAYSRKAVGHFSESVYQMTAEDVPTVAPDFELHAVGNTSLKVSWTSISTSSARGTVTGYRILYKRHSGAGTRDATMVASVIDINDAEQFEYIVEDLETDQVYDVRVLAGTNAGFPSALSETIWPWKSHVVSSRRHVGISDLSNVVIYALSSMSICLTWDTPKSVSGVDLLGYKIECTVKMRVSDDPRLVLLTDIYNRYVLAELQPNTEYTVSIWTFTDLGEGEPVTRTIKTLPLFEAANSTGTTTSAANTILNAAAVNETAVRLTLAEPVTDRHSPVIRCYRVGYQLNESLGQEVAVTSTWSHVTTKNALVEYVNSSKAEVLITELEPFTLYRFSVESCGTTVLSSNNATVLEIICRTEEGRPLVPRSLSWSLISPTDVQLNWDRPLRINGVLSSYMISCCEEIVESPNTQCDTHIENGTSQYVILRHLKTRTEYYFKVCAMTRKGCGPWSDFVAVRTGTSVTLETSSRGRGDSSGLLGNSDRLMGIIIGISIGVAGIIVSVAICVFFILMRNRCCPAVAATHSLAESNHIHTPFCALRCAHQRHEQEPPNGRVWTGNGHVPHTAEDRNYDGSVLVCYSNGARGCYGDGACRCHGDDLDALRGETEETGRLMSDLMDGINEPNKLETSYKCFGYMNEKQNVQRNSDKDVHDNCISEDLQRDSSISHLNNQYLSDSHCLPNSSRPVSLRSLSVMCPCTDDVAFSFTSKEENVFSNNLNLLNHNTCNGMCQLTQCDRLTSNSLAAWNDESFHEKPLPPLHSHPSPSSPHSSD